MIFENSVDPLFDLESGCRWFDELTFFNLKLCYIIQMAVLPKVRSALCAASQLPGEGPTDVEDAPAPAC